MSEVPVRANPFLRGVMRRGTINDSAPCEDPCVRKAVAERGLTPDVMGLSDVKAKGEAARGGPTATSTMGFGWFYPSPLDAPGGAFGVTEGSSQGRVTVSMKWGGDEFL
jgi:hypothetical protein